MLREALTHLAEPRCSDVDALLADATLRAAVERWLQVSIEACVDLAGAIAAHEGWTPPGTARDTFLVLGRHGRLPPDLARRLASAAGLRNVLVHDYAEVDLERLARIVAEDLDDLRAFTALAAEWFAKLP